MRCKFGFTMLCAAAILAGCASNASQSSADVGQGMLVIGVVLYDMNEAGRVDVGSGQYAVNSLSVKSLSNGQMYDIQLTSNHGMATLPAGTYCVNSILPQNYAPLTYCAQPFFKVSPGKILVAGYVDFAVNFPTHSYKLVDSFNNPQGLFDSLSKTDKDTLATFSRGGTAATD